MWAAAEEIPAPGRTAAAMSPKSANVPAISRVQPTRAIAALEKKKKKSFELLTISLFKIRVKVIFVDCLMKIQHKYLIVHIQK